MGSTEYHEPECCPTTKVNHPRSHLLVSPVQHLTRNLPIPNIVLNCSSSTGIVLLMYCIRVIVLSIKSAWGSTSSPTSLPVHLCAASFATVTASFFLSYFTGSAAPKAANSDLSPKAVSLISARVWSNFSRSSCQSAYPHGNRRIKLTVSSLPFLASLRAKADSESFESILPNSALALSRASCFSASAHLSIEDPRKLTTAAAADGNDQ